MPNKRLSIARNFSALLSTQIAGRGVRFIYLIAIARILEPGEVGLYTYGIAFYLTLLGLSFFGQDSLLSTRIGGHRYKFPVTAAHSFTVILAATGITVIFAFVFLNLTETDTAVLGALSFFLLALIARGFALWVRSCFIALEQATWIPRYELTFRGLEAVTGTAALFMGGGLLTVCFLHFFFWGLEAAASFRLLAKRQGFRLRLGTNRRLLKGFLSISALFTANAWFLAAFSQVGIVGLRLVQPDAAVVAYFAIAMQFFTTLMIFPISLSQAIVPGLSRAHRNRTEADLQTVATAMKAALIIGGMVAVAANAVGPWVIALLFGERYLAAGETFAWLGWAIGPYGAAFMAAQALNALDARGRGAAAALVMVGVHVAVMAVLVALAGRAGGWAGGYIDAATAGVLAGSVLGAAAALAALGSRVKVAGHGWWIRPMVLTAIPAGIMHLAPLPPLAAGALSLVLLAALTWMTGVFSRAELERIAGRLGIGRPHSL